MARLDYHVDMMTDAQLTDEDKLRILHAGADVVRRFHREEILSMFNQVTGSLRESIQAMAKTDYVEIAPQGAHPHSTRGIRRHKGRKNGHYSGTNAEIGYILEYGSPRISARHWMESANEKAEEATYAAEEAAFNEICNEKGF